MQATQFKVSDKLKLVGVTVEDDTTNTEYKCNVKVQLAGDSIWDCTLKTVTIKSIHISETDWGGEDTSLHIAVVHTGKDNSWRIYTDTGFSLVEAVKYVGDNLETDAIDNDIAYAYEATYEELMQFVETQTA